MSDKNELLTVYKKWYANYLDNSLEYKTAPFLLDVSNRNCETMLFGQESHEQQADIISDFEMFYKRKLKSYFEYQNKILNYEKIQSSSGKHTRRLGGFEYYHLFLCNISSSDRKNGMNKQTIEEKYNRVIVNNICKYSNNGMHTNFKCIEELYRTIDGLTIFQHEINYFRPQKIIFACGPNYKENINKAFGIDIKDADIPHNTATGYAKDISLYFNEKFPFIKQVLYTVHPQRALTKLKNNSY